MYIGVHHIIEYNAYKMRRRVSCALQSEFKTEVWSVQFSMFILFVIVHSGPTMKGMYSEIKDNN